MQATKSKRASKLEIIGNVADRVIQRLKPDPFERMRLLYNKELRPFQWEWWFLMDEHPDVLCKACPRVGKTVDIAIKNLDECVTYADEQAMVFGPRYEQACNSFQPAYEIVENSEPLMAFVDRNVAGKQEIGKGFVKFINRSSIKCFGVTSNFEGENASILHVDELDDVPTDTLKRIFGRAIGKNKSGLPTRKRLSGVIWGKLNIFAFDNDPDFFTLPAVDVYQALAAGYLDEKSVRDARSRMTTDEWLRTMCLIYVEARNLIWEAWLKMSQYIGLHWNIVPVPPLKGAEYRKRGAVSFGLDMGHQGGGDDSSSYSLQVTEAVGKYRRWVWGRVWPPDADPNEIITDVCDAWDFFRPDTGFGDALDANLIAQINEELYNRGAVYWNWKLKGKNQEEGWREWARHGLLTPIHNLGHTKHYMYKSLRNSIFNSINIDSTQPSGNIFVFPMGDREKSKTMPSWMELQMVIRELGNLVAEKMPSGYLKIERYKKKEDDYKAENFGESLKLGDDRPDALAMSHYGLDYMEARKSTGKDVSISYLKGI